MSLAAPKNSSSKSRVISQTQLPKTQESKWADRVLVEQLRYGHEAETLAFLAQRPVHTIIMSGFIGDNGLESPLNRGVFYASRDTKGRIDGVALIGHHTLAEVRREESLIQFARLASRDASVCKIIGEWDSVETFWNHYGRSRRARRESCRQSLLEARWPVPVARAVNGLRLATSADLSLVMSAHRRMGLEKSGVDLAARDPEGFRLRCGRRIEQRRVWVWVRRGQLIFKADVVSATPEVKYLEGIYVNPDERGRGYGTRCLSEVNRKLLTDARVLCLLVDESELGAQAMYRRAGYTFSADYQTIFTG